MVHQSEVQLQEQLIQEHLKKLDAAEKNFIPFVRHVWPDFVSGYHHKKIAKKFEDIRDGKIKRLIVNMPPRHTKSEFASFLFPSWLVGNKPTLKIIQTTHNTELAVRFGRKMKNLIDSQVYQQVFDEVSISADSKAAGRWETNKGGEYFAAGVGSSITGRGADLLIIDDPHSEQDALSETAFDSAYEWYTSGPRQRLQPGGAIVIVMTRWSVKDLTGRLIEAQAKEPKADQWELIEFPAILPSNKPIWPEYWDIDSLTATKASLTEQKWQAQWQQNPTAEEGSILKREWWQVWDEEEVPDLIHVIQSYDTAFSKKETADYSAITTWGIFTPHESMADAIILIDAVKGKYDFPELKMVALDQYKYWQPETVIIEAKASGQSLLQEFRRMGIPVMDFTPGRGNDKHARVNACAPIFESQQVWYPRDEHFAQEVIEECAAFPHGEHDDYVDSTTQAMLRYRQGSFITTYSDEDEVESYRQRKYVYY